MKNRSSQFVVVGLFLVMLGAILKVIKLELYATTFLTIGLFLEISAGLIFFYDRVTSKK